MEPTQQPQTEINSATPLPQQPIPSIPPVTIPPKQNNKLLIDLVVVAIILVAGVGGYWIGFRKNNTAKQNITPSPATTVTTTIVLPSQKVLPTESTQPNITSLGNTTVSFADVGNDIYLKHTITSTSDKVMYGNDNLQSIIGVYSPDTQYEPTEIAGADASKYTWTDLVTEPIVDLSDSTNIEVTDRLFSFKKVPNTNNFLFVEEFARDTSQDSKKTWAGPHQFERLLYVYDRGQSENRLKKVQTYTADGKNYSFPKIDTFSNDGKYVSLQMFGCWNCGGHQPETLLLNLQTLQTKNIGKAVEFTWKDNGAYTYKDYVVIDCPEPQPGECRQDPETLPQKSGQF